MRKSGCVFFLALALVWTVGTQPAKAQAADAGFTPGFAVRLYGGLGYQSIGDLNTGLKGWSDFIIYERAPFNFTVGGAYENAHYGFELGGDLIYQFSPHFGFGIGSGYFRTTTSSQINFTATLPGQHDQQWTFKPGVSVVPIRPSLFVFFPLGRSLNLSLNAGPEYYLASATVNIRSDTLGLAWYTIENKVTGQGFGFHGGIGLELRVSSVLSLILEGQGRLAKINEMTGTYTYTESSGFKEQSEGLLYYLTYLYSFQPFPLVFVNNTLPSNPSYQNPRKAVLDLSGWSAVVGFLVRL